MKEKYFRFIDKNLKGNFKNKKALIIGGTGGTGKALCEYALYLGMDLILCARNLELANKIKAELNAKYNNNIQILKFDFLNDEVLNDAFEFLKEQKVDYFFNDAGIYHQNIRLINNKDVTYLVNFLKPIEFINRLFSLENYKKTRFVNVASLSYMYKKVNLEDPENLKTKIKTMHYATSKRMLVLGTLILKNNGVNITLAHPGVSTTNLFDKKNNAFPKIFYYFFVPLMKIIFMNKDKAALSLLFGINGEFKLDEWSGPRGLLHSWGYPNKQKLKKSLFKELSNERIVSFIKEETGI